jgi:hypothetical protein
MCRPTLFDHPKFHRFALLMNKPRPEVLGYLEYLWKVGYASGNPEIGDAKLVESLCEWAGEPGALVKALVGAGFLDVSSNGCLTIHDLQDHCPEYVRSRHRMENWRKRKSKSRKKVKTDQPVTQPLRNGYDSPAPAPAPAPIEEIQGCVCNKEPGFLLNPILEEGGSTSIPPSRAKGGCRGGAAGFETFWESYPKKVAKKDAQRAWDKLKPDGTLQSTIQGSLQRLKDSDQWQRGFVPNGATFLNGRRWEDQPLPQTNGKPDLFKGVRAFMNREDDFVNPVEVRVLS